MVVKALNASDLSELDTKQRIMEVAIHLFALKGFDGASIREIASMADVNVASLNYHFKSKENLRHELMEYITTEFKAKINNIPKAECLADYAVKVFEAMTQDSAKCLNQFKLILEADAHPCDSEPYPVGYEQFSSYLSVELHKKVPAAERLWLINVLFSYIMHMSVMSSTNIGKTKIETFIPNKRNGIPAYIKQLAEALIRDLNGRYA